LPAIKASIAQALAVAKPTNTPQEQRHVLLPDYNYFEERVSGVLTVVGSGITNDHFKAVGAEHRHQVAVRILNEAAGQSLRQRFTAVVAALKQAIKPFMRGEVDAVIDGTVAEQRLKESETSFLKLFEEWKLTEPQTEIPELRLSIPDVSFPTVVVTATPRPGNPNSE
jgi:4-hydroxy-L-threonine phosphate dehydrogenase PdxA